MFQSLTGGSEAPPLILALFTESNLLFPLFLSKIPENKKVFKKWNSSLG